MFPGGPKLQGVRAILPMSVTEVGHERLVQHRGHVSGSGHERPWSRVRPKAPGYPGEKRKPGYPGTGTRESVCDDFLLS